MQTNHMQREVLTLTAKTLARKAGVEVILTHLPTGATDGRRVYINQRMASVKSDWARDIVRGLIDHEVLGHALHTNFDAWHQGVKLAQGRSGKRFDLLHGIFAVFEDLRIESEAGKLMPGAHINLARCVLAMCQHTDIFGSEDADHAAAVARSNPASAVTNFLLVAGRSLISSGQESALRSRTKIWTDIVRQMFGKAFPESALEIAERARQAKSTLEVFKRAEEMLALVEKIAESGNLEGSPSGDGEQGESSQKSKGSKSSEGSKSEGEKSDGSESEGEESEGEESEGEESEGEGEEGEGEEGPDGSPSGDGESGESGESGQSSQSQGARGGESSSGEPGQDSQADHDSTGGTDASTREFAKQALNGSTDPKIDLADAVEKALIKEMSASDSRDNNLNAEIVGPDRGMKGQVAVDKVSAIVRSRLASKLELLLESKSRRWSEVSLSGRRLECSRLYRTGTFDGRIFMRKHEEEAVNTAVSILFDGSGSMDAAMQCKPDFLAATSLNGISRMGITASTVTSLADLLDQADVPFEVGVFADRFYLAKTFDLPWRRARGMFKNVWGSGTVLYPALLEMVSRLAERDEERKLLVLVTDGQVSSNDCDAIVELCLASKFYGVDVATLFVGSSNSMLSSRLARAGFKATATNHADAVADFLVKSVEEAII